MTEVGILLNAFDSSNLDPHNTLLLKKRKKGEHDTNRVTVYVLFERL